MRGSGSKKLFSCQAPVPIGFPASFLNAFLLPVSLPVLAVFQTAPITAVILERPLEHRRYRPICRVVVPSRKVVQEFNITGGSMMPTHQRTKRLLQDIFGLLLGGDLDFFAFPAAFIDVGYVSQESVAERLRIPPGVPILHKIRQSIPLSLDIVN